MMVGCVLVAMATRWFLRNFVSVKCPFCGGKTYEIRGRGNRFMCSVCGKDH
jgi:transposase-like protein